MPSVEPDWDTDTSPCDGYSHFGVKAAALMDEIDGSLRHMAQDLGCDAVMIPSTVDGEVLKRCGYFRSFPHLLAAAVPLSATMLGEVSARNSADIGQLSVVNRFLTPSACLPLYPLLEQGKLRAHSYTARVKVFRNEEAYSSIRLWEFTVREFVFVGTVDFVGDRLATLADRAVAFARSLYEGASLVDAADSFYPVPRENRLMQSTQKTSGLKKELTIPFSGGCLALASFNRHLDHFSRPFKFLGDGSTVSGCAGFGLERWVAAAAGLHNSRGCQ